MQKVKIKVFLSITLIKMNFKISIIFFGILSAVINQSFENEVEQHKAPVTGVFETIKEMENYFDKMYIIEHLRSNMHTKLDVLNQVKAQLMSEAETHELKEQDKMKFASLVDSMTKTYKLLDIILVGFLPTKQDLLEIVEENTHLFGNHEFKTGGGPDLNEHHLEVVL